MSAIGLGFLVSTSHLFLTTIAFLTIAVGALAFGARHRGYGPFFLGLIASAIVLAAKFRYDSSAAMYLGLALLAGASLWTARPRSKGNTQ
ncbi:MAG: hypothetical protein HY235_09840 [Acidobacteria bacterium]|nr:hypothetical protein [Acidobacteriota bacterium]